MFSASVLQNRDEALSAYTLNFSVLGYFGHRLIRWAIGDPQADMCKVTLGHGEYVVFQQLANGQIKQLPRDLFQRVYPVLNRHSPVALAKGNHLGRLSNPIGVLCLQVQMSS